MAGVFDIELHDVDATNESDDDTNEFSNKVTCLCIVLPPAVPSFYLCMTYSLFVFYQFLEQEEYNTHPNVNEILE